MSILSFDPDKTPDEELHVDPDKMIDEEPHEDPIKLTDHERQELYELRARAYRQKEASRARGTAYRTKMARAGQTRFSKFVPKDAVPVVEEAVEGALRRFRALAESPAPSIPGNEADP